MIIHTRSLFRRLLLLSLVTLLVGGQAHTHSASRESQALLPNILFIILDDVGKDQLASFNPAAPSAALTPVLNAIAAVG